MRHHHPYQTTDGACRVIDRVSASRRSPVMVAARQPTEDRPPISATTIRWASRHRVAAEPPVETTTVSTTTLEVHRFGMRNLTTTTVRQDNHCSCLSRCQHSSEAKRYCPPTNPAKNSPTMETVHLIDRTRHQPTVV